MLGGGGPLPNGKVLGGTNFGDQISDPMPQGNAHGTACAGILAGNVITNGDYIGGVAPGAKLYALKVLPGADGTGPLLQVEDRIVAAWDWCVSHKEDDTNNPILVISTSMGGDRLYTFCDGSRVNLAASANNAVARGITLVVSSGNEGYCDSISSPACLSGVIAVGAVYDASIGPSPP